MHNLLTPSLFVDNFRETFGFLGYQLQCLGNFSACLLLVKFIIDFIVTVLRGLELRKVSVAPFGFVKSMLGEPFHLFVLSLQTPMYATDANKNKGNLRMQSVIANENLAATMYEKNPFSLHTQVQFLENPIPIS